MPVAAFADNQRFRSTFSTQALDRNSETLALDQRVPTISAGGWLQLSRRFGNNLLAAGGDIRWVTGETEEEVYNAGVFLRDRVAGGEQIIGGVFLQDVYTPHPMLELVGGIRGDYWYSYDGTRRDTPPPAGVPGPADVQRHRADHREPARSRCSSTRRPPRTCAPPRIRASACRPSTSSTASSACGTT